MDDRRWGFEEAEDWEYEKTKDRTTPAESTGERLSGRDADEIVEVLVTLDAQVIAVRLSSRWRQAIDPRALGSSVLAAANNATMRVLARNAQSIDVTAAAAPLPRPDEGGDETPLSNSDVKNLLDQVSAELDTFTSRVSAVADQAVEVRSAGGHVWGAAQQGQVRTLDIDATWATRSRSTEVELEVVEVLRGLRQASSPGELASGPGGGAISELMNLAADPHRLLRRLGMPVPDTNEGA